jgi:chromate transport protein ChrA
VFGGGHVVLPLLQAEVVTPGWVSNADFLTGYGMAQAVPGPLFTFAAYLLLTVCKLAPWIVVVVLTATGAVLQRPTALSTSSFCAYSSARKA